MVATNPQQAPTPLPHQSSLPDSPRPSCLLHNIYICAIYLHSMTCANFDPRKCQASTPLVPMWDELQALSRAPGESHHWMLSAPLVPSHQASSPAMAPFSLSSSCYGAISPSLSSSYGTIQPSALLSQHCLHTC